MKTDATQKEILLVTNNSFAHRRWCSKEMICDNDLTDQEQMEELCANGQIYDILPEVFEAPFNSKLYLWKLQPGFSFIQLHYSEFPLDMERSTSIDPHNSLPFMCYN